MAHYKAEQDDWLVVYLKYLLFVFNFFFWVSGFCTHIPLLAPNYLSYLFCV